MLSAAGPPDQLFVGDGNPSSWESPLVDLEQLQFESAAEGGKLRRDLSRDGGVAPLTDGRDLSNRLGGKEEQFAFQRAVSRLIEMQSAAYLHLRGDLRGV